jgi:hypothetical protein
LQEIRNTDKLACEQALLPHAKSGSLRLSAADAADRAKGKIFAELSM